MPDLRQLFDEMQVELLKLGETYQRKLALIDTILTESNVRWLDDKLRGRLKELLALAEEELTEDKQDLKVWGRVKDKLVELGKLINSENSKQVFELLHKREFWRGQEEDDDELKAVLQYDKKIEDQLNELRRELQRQSKTIKDLMREYDYKRLLKFFEEIIFKEIIIYNGKDWTNADEYERTYGLYIKTAKAAKGLISLCRNLNEEFKIINASEKEDRQAIEFIKFLVDFVKKSKIHTIVFLDKSARPFSYAFLVYCQKHSLNRPKILNINWNRNRDIWHEITIHGPEEHNELYDLYMDGKLDELKDRIIEKFPFLGTLFTNCKGKNVLLVDDVIASSGTLRSLKKMIETLFEPKTVYAHAFALQSPGASTPFPTFITDLPGADHAHSWVKAMLGTGFIDSGEGYTTTMFSAYKKYRHHFEYLRQQTEKAKKHIEEAVRKYG